MSHQIGVTLTREDMAKLSTMFGDQNQSINYHKISKDLGLHNQNLNFIKSSQHKFQNAQRLRNLYSSNEKRNSITKIDTGDILITDQKSNLTGFKNEAENTKGEVKDILLQKIKQFRDLIHI